MLIQFDNKEAKYALLECVISFKPSFHILFKNEEDTLKFMLHHGALDGQGHGSGFEIELFFLSFDSWIFSALA